MYQLKTHRRTLNGTRICAVLAVMIASQLPFVSPSAADPGLPPPTTFSGCTKSTTTYTVPSGVYRVHIMVASGAGNSGTNNGGQGGKAATASGEAIVQPGDKFGLRVGCAGWNGGWGTTNFCKSSTTGSNYGASVGGGSGGGTSVIRKDTWGCEPAKYDPGAIWIIAGAGGGGGGGTSSKSGGRGGWGGLAGSNGGSGSGFYDGGGGRGADPVNLLWCTTYVPETCNAEASGGKGGGSGSTAGEDGQEGDPWNWWGTERDEGEGGHGGRGGTWGTNRGGGGGGGGSGRHGGGGGGGGSGHGGTGGGGGGGSSHISEVVSNPLVVADAHYGDGFITITPLSGPASTPIATASPAVQSRTTGQSAAVDIVVRDQYGLPMRNAAVSVTVHGVNATSGSVTTDQNGAASYTYSGSAAGPDVVVFEYEDVTMAAAGVAWQPASDAALVTLSPATQTQSTNESVTVTALVQDQFGNPVPGVNLRFTRSFANPGQEWAITDANGEATHTYVCANAGMDVIEAAVPGSDALAGRAAVVCESDVSPPTTIPDIPPDTSTTSTTTG